MSYSSTSNGSTLKQPAHSDDTSTSKALTDKLSHMSDIDNIWLLPDGVSDLLSEEAQKQEWLRYQLTRLLVSRGYELTCPPMLEFTESLLGNASEDVKRQTFKIIDRLSGRLMGVRADITPQIQRIDAHLTKLGKATAISRYCYAGHVIRTLPYGLFGSRTPLQLGAEIFGTDSFAADIELIDVLFCLMNHLNLNQRLHIDIGHMAIFARLKELARLSENEATALINLYANKALPELKIACADLAMGEDFYQLAVHGHDVAALKEKLSDTAKSDQIIIDAVRDVKQMVAHIKDNYQGNVSVDITELGYHYHTGIVFTGYFENESQAVVRGGRFNGQAYNESASAINDDVPARPATGFSLEVTRLQRHISLNHISKEMPKLIWVDYKDLQTVNAEVIQTQSSKEDTAVNLIKALDEKTEKLREAGDRVVRPLSASDIPSNVTHHLVLDNNNWVVKAI